MMAENEPSAQLAVLGLIAVLIFSGGCTSVQKGDLIGCDNVITITDKWQEPGKFSPDGFVYYVNASEFPVPLKIKKEIYTMIPMNQTILYTMGWHAQGMVIDGYKAINVEPVQEPGYRNTCRVI